MKNPLRRRLLRELKGELPKYLVVFLILLLFIGFISGFLVASKSMMTAYDASFEKYNIEDGNFHTAVKMNRAQKKAVQAFGVRLCDNFYEDRKLDTGQTLRIFADRTEVDLVCLMEGELPDEPGEIALDRMFAANNDIAVGDLVTSQGKTWEVCGLAALPDYSAQFQNNNDSMFDALQFGVSVVCAEDFARLDEDRLTWCYSWKYDDPPADEAAEQKISEEFRDHLNGEVKLTDYTPQHLNQAIHFTGDDLGRDNIMMQILLYIFMAIIAFVFAITISNTIAQEAAVIGTLRASGYTRGELIRHYMAPPLLVTLAAALLGNILGYSLFKGLAVYLYYNSYSLTTYTTIWDGDAFVRTTVIPILIMLVINGMILRAKLKLSPLKFLRRDISGRRQKRVMRLSPRLPFFTRFHLRVIFQNTANYVILFVGVLFANLLLLFGMAFPAMVDNFQASMTENLLCTYQYILTAPPSLGGSDHKLDQMIDMIQFYRAIETENEDAEKFSVYGLHSDDPAIREEEILLYGIVPDSRYIPLELSGSEVYVSAACAEKYDLEPGDTIALKEAYEDTRYTFTVTGIFDYQGSVSLYMAQDYLNETFDLGDGFFCGYFSDSEITDIDESYIGTVIDLDALTRVSRQLDHSMADMMGMVQALAVVIFIILIYLLSKIIIEKNAQSISMTKILGYKNAEISRLYIMSTTIVVVLSLLLSIPIVVQALLVIMDIYLKTAMTGWIHIELQNSLLVRAFFIGLCTYLLVAFLEYRRIRRIPMDEALKNVE